MCLVNKVTMEIIVIHIILVNELCILAGHINE